jgi:hypothetical protein
VRDVAFKDRNVCLILISRAVATTSSVLKSESWTKLKGSFGVEFDPVLLHHKGIVKENL